jgi:UDP-N-acetylmuramoyl-tripeptide--D-alanyl-D-alanine ligase
VRLPAGELAKLPHKEFRNHDVLRHAVITGVSTDTRTLRQGDLFVALRGTAFDGHEFVAQVRSLL